MYICPECGEGSKTPEERCPNCGHFMGRKLKKWKLQTEFLSFDEELGELDKFVKTERMVRRL